MRGLSGSTEFAFGDEGDEGVTVGVGGDFSCSEFIAEFEKKDVDCCLKSTASYGHVGEKSSVVFGDVRNDLGLVLVGDFVVWVEKCVLTLVNHTIVRF
jgi:hypothetical protein